MVSKGLKTWNSMLQADLPMISEGLSTRDSTLYADEAALDKETSHQTPPTWKSRVLKFIHIKYNHMINNVTLTMECPH